jgi:sulfoquinovose isomerase
VTGLESNPSLNPSPVPGSWRADPVHRAWLQDEAERLVSFSKGSVHPGGGFAWLDTVGKPVLDRPVETWITTRMTHVLAVGSLLGIPGCRPLIDHGVDALQVQLFDTVNGGWYSSSTRPNAGEKRAYEQAFVVLAASSSVLAGHSSAESLLRSALNAVEKHFWDEQRGVVRDVFVEDWSATEPYGGANANMHSVEAFIAAADVTGDRVWLERAVRIADFFINRHARAHAWRIPEHFDENWDQLPDYNHDVPAHQFRPYGATVGHGFEWSRLCLHLNASLGTAAPQWLEESAKGLFHRAVTDGWLGDGFLYTTDWEGSPVVTDRLHWVVCEAIAAAAALERATGDPSYGASYSSWWDLADRCFIDRADGSWHAQLDGTNRPASSVWSGKPDTYHAFQATLLPRLPLAPSLASGVARGLLDS